MCALIFSKPFIWNICRSKKNFTRYYHKCTQVVMQSTHYSCQTSMKLEFSVQIFERKVIFHENPSSGSRVVLWGRTGGRADGRTQTERDMKKLIVAFRNAAKSPKITPSYIISSEEY
jgi:hypothetical protein